MAKSGENFDDAQLQPLSDVETIKPEIKDSAATTPRTSSLFNFDGLNGIFRMRKTIESSEDDINNEIEKSDVIVIEVPVIGSEFMGKQKQHENEALAEIDIFTTPSTFDLSTADAVRDDGLTFPPHSQGSPSQEPTTESALETTTAADLDTTLPVDNVETTTELNVEEIQSVESELMEQWRSVDGGMIDDDFPESEMFTMESRARPRYPFNVKIVVNNEDEKKSCRSKTSCSQVSFSRPRLDIDRQFYSDYSDEDLFLHPEVNRYFEIANDMRTRNTRRAADDMITPAPRFPPIRGIKKPSFIERLESESSLERSERINKNLDGLMRFISVWAQVDKFVSERARSAIRRVAYMTGDDYDDFTLGSPKKRASSKRMIDEPFT